MTLLVVIWWLGFFTALGLCAGSFLNVVIYRLPRGQSLRDPVWSRCPHCGSRIRWYDNLPILSYLLLRGRCRDCRSRISIQYLLVEALTAIVVLNVMDAFFIGQTRSGLLRSEFGLTDQLAADWPILLAHLVLFSCLLSMSAIDIEHYWVDIRFTHVATLVGFVAHAMWTPRHSLTWIRPWDATAWASLLAVGGLGLIWVLLVCQPRMDAEDFGESGPFDDGDVTPDPSGLALATLHAPGGVAPQTSNSSIASAEAMTGSAGPHAEGSIGLAPPAVLQAAGGDSSVQICERPPVLSGVVFVAVLVAMLAAMGASSLGSVAVPSSWRLLAPMALIFLLVARLGMVARESDQHIVDAIHEERFGARRMVLEELFFLLPAIALGLLGLWMMVSGGALAAGAREALHWTVTLPDSTLFRYWQPLYGLATAASGFVIAGALGWAVRIGFTLLFGREAFGSGDVHLMAATGCVAGWPVVALGLFLTCVLALGGWLIALPVKRSRAIPLGPWLSLAFLIVVVYYDHLLRWPLLAQAIDNVQYLLSHNSQAVVFQLPV